MMTKWYLSQNFRANLTYKNKAYKNTTLIGCKIMLRDFNTNSRKFGYQHKHRQIDQ